MNQLTEVSKYYEVATPKVGNRNQAIPCLDLPRWTQHSRVHKNELYFSYYAYDEDIIGHLQKHKSVRGYKGNYYLDSIKLDVDRSKRSDEELLKAVSSIYDNLLKEIDEENIIVWYSGTGFHIEFPNIYDFRPSNILPKQVASVLTKIFPTCDNIYDGPRLLRAPYSINKKSNLWKVPLNNDLILLDDLQLIQTYSSTFPDDYIPVKLTELPSGKFISTIAFTPDVTLQERNGLVLEKRPKEVTKIVSCMQHLYNRGEKEGSRHNDLLRLISSWRRSGITIQGSEALAQAFAPSLAAHDVSRIVGDVYTRGFQYGCTDATMLLYCDHKCLHYKKKDYVQDVDSAESMEVKLRKFMLSDFSRTSFDFAGALGSDKEYRIYPGELVILLGDTGMNKTAILQNIVINLPTMKVLYATLEVSAWLLMRRNIQIAYSMNKRDIENYYKLNPNGSLTKRLNHICGIEVPPTVEAFSNIIHQHDPQIVVVDTIDGLKVNGKTDPFQRMEVIARELKELAVQHNTIIIGVSHVNRGAIKTMDGRKAKLDVHSAKYTSSIEQKADRIISIEGERDGTIRHLESHKTRDDNKFLLTVEFDFETFKCRSINNDTTTTTLGTK